MFRQYLLSQKVYRDQKCLGKAAVDNGSPTRSLSSPAVTCLNSAHTVANYIIIYALSYTPNDLVEETEAHKWL